MDMLLVDVNVSLIWMFQLFIILPYSGKLFVIIVFFIIIVFSLYSPPDLRFCYESKYDLGYQDASEYQCQPAPEVPFKARRRDDVLRLRF